MEQFDNVSVVKQANVYFDGRCVSHSLILADGVRKSVGVILPGATLTFNTGAPEIMEVIAGQCAVQLKGDNGVASYGAGQSFSVPGNSAFDITVSDTLHYVCHFG